MNIGELTQTVADACPIDLYCRAFSLVHAIRGGSLRLSALRPDGLHVATDGTTTIHLARRGRHWRYKRGVLGGIEGLVRQYHLDRIRVRPGGILIDCGANIGELGFWARSRGMRYLPFEPERLEADCNDLNNFGGEPGTQRKALWKEDAELTFYSKPGTADSSLFDMGTSKPTTVAAVALDNAVDPPPATGTNIFKVEAEGAEPEVLEGAIRTLPFMDYVAIDCGYERGHEKRHTFVETHHILTDAGFRPIHAHFRRVTMLYENTVRATP